MIQKVNFINNPTNKNEEENKSITFEKFLTQF
jgi:hypothetical protein